MNVVEVVYDLERVSAQHLVPRHTLEQMQVETLVSPIVEGLLVRVARYIPKRDGAEIRVPRDWWQHLKARWSPSWALRRWPVQMKVYRAVEYRPEPQVDFRELGPRAHFAWVDA